jgi:excisionase family DNA binding protein
LKGIAVSEFPIPPADGSNNPVLLRVEEAAQRLGVSRAQMYRLIAAGEVASVKIGSSRRVPTRCLDEFVDRLLGEQG